MREEATGSITVYLPAGGGACLAAHRLGSVQLPADLKEPQRAKILQAMAIGGTLTFTCRRYMGQPLGLNPTQWSEVFPDAEVLFKRGPTSDGHPGEVSKWKDGDHVETWDLGFDDLPTISLTEMRRRLAKGRDLDDVVFDLERHKPSYKVPSDHFIWQV
jgi:hypothetical protein